MHLILCSVACVFSSGMPCPFVCVHVCVHPCVRVCACVCVCSCVCGGGGERVCVRVLMSIKLLINE